MQGPGNISYHSRIRNFAAVFAVLVTLLLVGCASAPTGKNYRPFQFGKDTFAYANELKWEYHFDENGKWVSHPRDPAPEYALHCFVVARAARQFFDHARFDPLLPRTNATGYRFAVREVISRSARQPSPEPKKVVISGFANLHEFSTAYGDLLKAECGSALQSYFQRGHWRMIFPVSRKHQQQVAEDLWAYLEQGRPSIVHIFSFPSLTINHAILVYEGQRFADHLEFTAYDPNLPEHPAILRFDLDRRSFAWPRSVYFPGGEINAYIVYRNALY